MDAQEKMVAKKMRPVEKIDIHNFMTAELKLLELRGDIGFTEDDIMIILMTSLDLDYFTNLVVAQGEFSKWFNLNFKGESQEETDFLSAKHTIWSATTTLAMEVQAQYGMIQGDKSIIQTGRWW